MPAKKTAAELTAIAVAKIAARTTAQLCYDFAMTETQDMADPAVPMVRGWLMNELEKRDADAFEAWIFSDTETLPHTFYGV